MTLERAIAIAVEAHAGQSDKAGNPYILHPLRVMFAQNTIGAMIVGVLHDVVEDSAWTFDRLRAEGYNEDVLAALDRVTKRDGENYDDFISRSSGHPISRAVKLADLMDNMDVTRLNVITAKDEARLAKYRAAHARLESLRG